MDNRQMPQYKCPVPSETARDSLTDNREVKYLSEDKLVFRKINY